MVVPMFSFYGFHCSVDLYLILIYETQRRQYEGHNTLGYYTDQCPYGCGQYNGQGVYCGLSSASEVFLLPNYTNILVCLFYFH